MIMINGWMPRLSPDGRHVASGSGEWWLDERQLGVGWTPVWWDENRILINRGDGLWAYILDTDEHVELVPGARVNGLAAGGGRYAWYGFGPQGTGIYRDDGIYRAGLDPAVWGDHLALVSTAGSLWLDDVCIRRTAIRTTTTPPCVRVSAAGLTWIEYHGNRLEAWGLLWRGEPQHLAPTWRDCYFAVPVVGPHGIPWLLVSDGVRLMLVPWGAHVGYLVAEGKILHPDGAWTRDQWARDHWRVVWCDAHGHRFEAIAFPDAALMDFMADAPAPPPPPEISFTLWPGGSRVAPCTVEAVLTTKVRVQTHRWLKGPQGAALLAIDGADTDTHEYHFEAAGCFDVGMRAQGDDGALIPVPRQTVTITAPPRPESHERHNGWLLLQNGAGADVLPTLRSFRWEGCRVDYPGLVHGVNAVLDADMCPLAIIQGPEDIERLPDHPVDVDLYNEPNGASEEWPHLEPREYASLAVATMTQIRALGRRDQLWLNVNNLTRDGLAYLREVVRCGIPAECGFSPHRYPARDQDPRMPHRGFASRSREVEALLEIIGARPWGIGECGYHQARLKLSGAAGWFARLFGVGGWQELDDREIAERIAYEITFWRGTPAQFFCYYQYSDGASTTPLDRFGIRRMDGTWKGFADRRG